MKKVQKKRISLFLAAIMCMMWLSAYSDGAQAEAAGNQQTASAAEKTAALNVRGATIWPVQDIDMYDNDGNVMRRIKAGTPMKVLTQVGDYFKIYYDRKSGVVKAACCMINLPDIMPKEMQYDISNSYSSIYRIYGQDIDGVTGEILYPYARTGEESYLVPLLYPVAVKLYAAELAAIKEGYTLKIYDAYRPYAVTKELYARTSDFIEQNPVYESYMKATVNGVSYKQSNFLAESVSNHNYGIAVDLTLADLETGEELTMQSAMHELSIRSVLDLNNDNSNLLQDIMLSNGFSGLASEWWHFQIKEYKQEYAAFQVKPLE